MPRLRNPLCQIILSATFASASAAPVACPVDEGGVVITKPPYSAANDARGDVSGSFKKAIDDPKVKVICIPPGRYRFEREVFLRTGQELSLLGLSTDPNDAQIVWNGKINPFHSSPIRGIETRIRSLTVKNLTFDGSRSAGRAFNVLAAPSPNADTFVDVSNSRFQNIDNLPVWIEGFSRVRIANSKFASTKDAGILRSTNVEIVSNEVENSNDNCVSVSRGNSNVRVANNRYRNCRSSGIFVGGIDYKGDTKKAFTLEGDGPLSRGSACRIRSSDPKHFRYGMIGTQLTLRSGRDFAIVTISGWDPADTASAPCTLMTGVPDSLVRRSTNVWYDGPHFGGDGTIIEDNVIEGSLSHGVTLSLGVRNVVVRNNRIVSSGRFVNTDGSPLSAESFGVLVVGWFLGTDANAQRYAENIEIKGNTIIGPSAGGIRLGSQSKGGTRDIVVQDNRIDLSPSGARIGVLVDEHPDMPTRRNRVEHNDVTFDRGTSKGYAVRIDAAAGKACDSVKAASVDHMVGGTCAIAVGGACQSSAAPASLRCEGLPKRSR